MNERESMAIDIEDSKRKIKHCQGLNKKTFSILLGQALERTKPKVALLWRGRMDETKTRFRQTSVNAKLRH